MSLIFNHRKAPGPSRNVVTRIKFANTQTEHPNESKAHIPMSHAQPKQYLAATHRAVANADAIEWEELPSLAASLAQRLVQRGSWQRPPMQLRGANDSAFMSTSFHGSPWDTTMAAEFDPAPVAQPFQERLDGLVTREVNEPGVFHHFFGPNAGR
jgi:hypothetical protein